MPKVRPLNVAETELARVLSEPRPTCLFPFQGAVKNGIHRTVHAGEVGSPEVVREVRSQ